MPEVVFYGNVGAPVVEKNKSLALIYFVVGLINANNVKTKTNTSVSV